MRTIIIDKPAKCKKKNPFYKTSQHFYKETRASRAVRNRANFLIRNVMTGLKKKPEDRCENENSAINDVFRGLELENEAKAVRLEKTLKKIAHKLCLREITQEEADNEIAAAKKNCAPMEFPTAEHWYLSYYQLDAIMKQTKDVAYYSCSAQVNQQAIKKTCSSWESYFAAHADWKINPQKYKAEPKIPKYIRTDCTTAHFTTQVAKPSIRDGKLYLNFNNFGEIEMCPAIVVSGEIVKVEVKPIYGKYRILITYKDGLNEIPIPKNPKHILGLDVGVNNFLACVTNTGMIPILISGKYLKSENQWFNKERARLISMLTAGSDSKHSTKNSKRLISLSRKREAKFRDIFYKVAHFIMRICVKEGIEVVVIGHNVDIKQKIANGKTNNQNFVCIPYQKFTAILKFVGTKYGIPVIDREESYTSQASLLDFDFIPTYGEKDADEQKFSGYRKHRGLYISGNKTPINADVNAAGNIVRKEYPHAFDGIDMSCLTTDVNKVKIEDILNKKDHFPVSHRGRDNQKKTSSFGRHEYRKARRAYYSEFFEAKRRPEIKEECRQAAIAKKKAAAKETAA